ncbi:hypothetical protein LWM68_40255 [Niabella sp. W65]|nr:hypothetical protein [Niabella sp. W65]MCH7368425.1 hypothetical protein [Niabella sp. W65]
MIYTSIGVIAGLLIGWLLGKSRAASGIQAVKDEAQIKYNELDRELVSLKATSASELAAAQQQMADRQQEYHIIKADLLALSTELDNSRQQYASVKAAYDTARQTLIEKNNEYLRIRSLSENLQAEQGALHQQLATALATNKALTEKLQTQKEEMEAMSKKFNTEFENIANRILKPKPALLPS